MHFGGDSDDEEKKKKKKEEEKKQQKPGAHKPGPGGKVRERKRNAQSTQHLLVYKVCMGVLCCTSWFVEL